MSNNLLKHQGIIDALSANQKFRLLTDLYAVNDEEFFSVGIPKIQFSNLLDNNNRNYLSPLALSRTWNPTLIEDVAVSQLNDIKGQNNNLIELPLAKPTVSPYGLYTAEDPLLVETVIQSYINASQKLSLMPVISGVELTNDEIEFLDSEPDKRDVYEYIAKPYFNIARKNKNIAFSFSSFNENIKFNRYFSDIATNNLPNFILSTNTIAENTVSEILNNKICIKGSYKKLTEASENYKKICQNISEGKNTSYDLEIEIAQGKAISNESIDQAVDNLIEFAFECNKQEQAKPVSDNYLLKHAVSEATVLLKNEKQILPIKSAAKKKKICVIGSIGVAAEYDSDLFSILQKNNFDVQYIKGYDLNKQCEVLNTDEIRFGATNADYIVLNLSTPHFFEERLSRRCSLNLPANQIALIHALSDFSQKTIAVVSSDYAVNMPFARDYAAVLLVPGNMTSDVYSAVLEMIIGQTSPSGKLNSAVYFNFEQENKNILAYKRRGTMKTGSFIGYRYYDSNGYFNGFPFGFGLSYTKFSFSDLKVTEKKIEVVVKNVGKYTGSETIQVYVQKNNSSLLRPKKELAAFSKITLNPQETKKISLMLEIPSIFDLSSDKFSLENGDYTVYVATSVSDIKLKGKLNINGKVFEPDNKKLSDYLQSESNIISDHYTLEANSTNMKRSMKNIIYSLLMMLVSLGIGIYCGISGIDDNFFTFVSVILLISSLSLLFYDVYERTKQKAKEASELDKITNENFFDATQVSVLTSENMFINEFDTPEESESPKIFNDEKSSEIDELSYVDNGFDFQNAMDEFELLLSGAGYRTTHDSVKCLFSALAASRLIILNQLEDESFYATIDSLSKLFNTEVYFDVIDDTVNTEYDLLYGSDSEGNKISKNVTNAIECASNEPEKIFIIALNNVIAADLPKYFVPFLKYTKNPVLSGEFSILDEQNTSTQYVISQNIRFILNLQKGENIESLPNSVGESAAVMSMEFESLNNTQATNINTSHKMNHYQLIFLTEKSKQRFNIEESVWKKIDKLEDYIIAQGGDKFGNKLFVSMETFASVYMSCGGENAKAIDRCIAYKLLPVLIPLFKDTLKDDQQNFTEKINNIFENAELTETRKVLIEYLSVVK